MDFFSPFNTKVQPSNKKNKAVGKRDADSLLQELLHHHKICSSLSVFREQSLVPDGRQTLSDCAGQHGGPLPSRLRLRGDIS